MRWRASSSLMESVCISSDSAFPARGCLKSSVSNSPIRGNEFSLSPRERAGVRADVLNSLHLSELKTIDTAAPAGELLRART
jgi:hypothetical protein